jgi:hypothetical protein
MVEEASFAKHFTLLFCSFYTACRYKVWYLEPCDAVDRAQIVHLILSKGGVNCELAKHLTKVPTRKYLNWCIAQSLLQRDTVNLAMWSDFFVLSSLQQILA